MPKPAGPRPMGPKPQIKNPGKLFARLMGFIFKNYGVQYLIVIVCILVNVFASIQGTQFLKTLIDDYISPLLLQDMPDFTPLFMAMARVALF